ncbi:MAG: sulfide-dependent adenosine diphosphate thiazole synthase [Candidatus Hodarchaeaceae archaeon]|nr:sulfide-dependent adenosine diphosphate thiazole synthase [Candidatus Hodarchaeaceae archaeon]
MEDTQITAAIVKRFMHDLLNSLELDVAVVGAGPSGITAARYLAKSKAKVAVFERELHVGGGMWGGGILFPRVVIQDPAKRILEEVGVELQPTNGGYYTADSVECVSKCTSAAIDAGARVLVGLAAEDVMIRGKRRIAGVVLNWGAVEAARLHVDPVGVAARVVIDATGHDASIARVVQRKIPGARFPTRTGGVVGEQPMWADVGEREIIRNTREIYPGLVVTGMAANAVFGSPRMGPVFGGMLLSGKRAAEVALKLLRKK